MPNHTLLGAIGRLPWAWYALALFVLVLDQVTKTWANTSMQYNIPIEVFTGFNLTLRYNQGAAFSFLADSGGWQVWFLGALATIVSVGIVAWIAKLGRSFSFETFGLTLILGGAVGNLVDRIVYGYVIDFIELYYQSYYWPAFNVADMAIMAGAGLFLYDGFFKKKKTSND